MTKNQKYIKDYHNDERKRLNLTKIIFGFWSNSPVNIHCLGNIYYIFVHVQNLMLVIVNFWVMFTDFGLIHSVILIWSSE